MGSKLFLLRQQKELHAHVWISGVYEALPGFTLLHVDFPIYLTYTFTIACGCVMDGQSPECSYSQTKLDQ